MVPARAASPVAITTTAVMYGRREMPSAATMSGFCTPARTTRPKLVFFRSSQRPSTQAMATTKDGEAVARVDQVADEDLSAQPGRNAKGRGAAPKIIPQRLLRHLASRRSAAGRAPDRPGINRRSRNRTITRPSIPTASGEDEGPAEADLRREEHREYAPMAIECAVGEVHVPPRLKISESPRRSADTERRSAGR